jgi:uncharacterized ion transporter superfamily protein YfcC
MFAMHLRIPHPLVLLVGCIIAAAVLTHVVRAGEFDRRDDPATGRRAVVPGSFHAVAQSPVGPFATLKAVPRGMIEAASVIVLVFLVGGALSVVESTGAFNQGVTWLLKVLRHRTDLIVPICCVTFAAGGAVEGMWEEIIPLMPVLLLLVRSAGYDPITAVAMSIGSAAVGIAFSPINPFSVGIAQRVAQLPLLSGLGFRMAVLTAGLAIWTWWTMRHAKRTRTTPDDAAAEATAPLDWRRAVILLMLGATFVAYVVGALRYDWGFDELGALFFGMGVLAGLLAGLGIDGTARAFVEGFRSMAFAATLIGFARAIFVVLDQGRIVDTVIHGMVTPLADLPAVVFALGMTVVQAAISIAIPSTSGRAVLTMPILVPMSDLLGVSRQVAVFAYQFGAGVINPIIPTDGTLMAVLALAGLRFDRWFRFAAPACAALFGLGLIAIAVAVVTGVR